MIPLALHQKVRQKQEDSGKTLSDYVTYLIEEFYKQEGGRSMSGDLRTVAFQVDAALFERFKDYLKAKGIRQNAFFLSCIQKALSELPVTAEQETQDDPRREAEQVGQ